MYDYLITGATGFVGSNIIKNFGSKKIVVITRKKNFKFNSKLLKIIYIKEPSDLFSKLKKIKVKTVIHSATHYVKSHKKKDIKNIHNANLVLGNIILEMSKELEFKKFINISTIWEINYFKSKNYQNLYSLSKKMFSLILNFYFQNKSKFKFYNLYLSDTFGYNDKRKKILNEIKKKLKLNKKIKIISSKLIMNFLNIKDLMNALELIEIKNNIKSGNYLITNNKNFSIKKIIKIYNLKNKKKIKYIFLGSKKISTLIPKISKLPNWKIRCSSIDHIVNFLKI